MRNAIDTENTNRYNAAIVNYNLITPNMFPPNTVLPQLGPNAVLEDYNNWKNQIYQLNPSNNAIQYLNQIKDPINHNRVLYLLH